MTSYDDVNTLMFYSNQLQRIIFWDVQQMQTSKGNINFDIMLPTAAFENLGKHA
jgi:hypothetical protein